MSILAEKNLACSYKDHHLKKINNINPRLLSAHIQLTCCSSLVATFWVHTHHTIGSFIHSPHQSIFDAGYFLSAFCHEGFGRIFVGS